LSGFILYVFFLRFQQETFVWKNGIHLKTITSKTSI
jgi:hypothetical protein